MREPSPKRIYLARRNPALTPDAFRARWRRHGAIAMARASRAGSVLRYVQADPIPFTGGLAGASGAEFVEKYDAAAFDAKAETMPLSAFEPMVRRLMATPKRTIYDNLRS